uniref:Uncharacterized protein n=1 Tax=Arundo donax TaxID=35708 RepID=A0A0A9F9U3_ARUDO
MVVEQAFIIDSAVLLNPAAAKREICFYSLLFRIPSSSSLII